MASMRVSVFGHSFVRRLGDYARCESWENLRLDTNEFDVRFFGLGGSNVRTVQQNLGDISEYQPEIVFVQIGSNDLCKIDCEPEKLALDIISLANLLCEGYDVNRVIVGQILKRQEPSSFHARRFWHHMQISLETYNERVIQTNRLLESYIEKYPKMVYWRHRGFWHQEKRMICADGVHLNSDGLHKYAYSIRKAVLNARELVAS